MPGLTDLGELQALRALGLGGIGLRSAVRQAAAANLASLVMAMPKVEFLAAAADEAGILDKEQVMRWHDEETSRALWAVRPLLRQEDIEAVASLLTEAADKAARDWKSAIEGTATGRDQMPRIRGRAASQDQGTLYEQAQRAVLEAGHLRCEPNELGGTVNGAEASAEHLQREIGLAIELAAMRPFISRVEQDDERAARRLAELLDPGTSHDWLIRINPRQGSRLSEGDFAMCLAARLGAELVASDQVCRVCGEALDGALSHALCCARAESARGHYAVVAAVADGMATVDTSIQLEARGLGGNGERPADILTTGALPGTKTALDVTIAAQDAKGAGLDACQTAYRRKMRNYAHLFPELRRQGIVFQPLVWSAEGRPHPTTTRVLECTMAAAGRRKGAEVAAEFRFRWLH